MADETFRPRKNDPVPSFDDEQEQEQQKNGLSELEQIEAVRRAAASEVGQSLPEDQLSREAGFQVKGNPPQAFLDALRKQGQGGPEQGAPEPKRGFGQMRGSQETPQVPPMRPGVVAASSGHLKELLEGLKGSTTIYE